MKILILCPGHIPDSPNEITTFFLLTNYYIPKAVKKHCACDIQIVPTSKEENFAEIKRFFSTTEFSAYDSILALGLRYFSLIPKDICEDLRKAYKGKICQIYDGTRIKKDPVDLTFTMKRDYFSAYLKHWYRPRKGKNFYIGWGADPKLNYPNQDKNILTILIDHPDELRSGRKTIDKTIEIIKQVEDFYISKEWEKYFNGVEIRRFTADNKIENVNFKNVDTNLYIGHENSRIPYTDICKEHCKAHLFIVTHPESLGMVTLETALSGALVVTPKKFIAKDRLKTIRHYEYFNTIKWNTVLNMIDIKKSREKAIKNSWDNVGYNIVKGIKKI